MATKTAWKQPEIQINTGELSKLFDRVMPHSPEAEMSLIGSMILAGAENLHLVGEVLQIIKSKDDFYLPKHAEIFDAAVHLYDQHQALDLVQLTQLLRDRNQFDAVGGVDYLVELAESVPMAINAPHFARIVRDKAKLRHLINAAGMILKEAHESTENPGMILDKAEKRIFEIAQSSSADEPSALNELVHRAFEEILDRRDNPSTLTGVATGYHELNDMTGGLQKGDMIILAARPSMGKTSLALNIAENVAVHNQQAVAVFSIEMGKAQLAARLLASASGVDYQRIQRNMSNEQDIMKLQQAAADLAEAPMFIDDTPSLSVLELRAKARRLYSRHDIKLVIIDYLQLMSSPGAESRVNEVGEISRGVKALARELGVPVICLSQLNRNPEKRESNRPILSDLRESGSIEQDADVVMMLHREEYYHTAEEGWKDQNPDKVGLTELIICKQRNGPVGVVNLQFNREITRFENRAHTSIQEPDF